MTTRRQVTAMLGLWLLLACGIAQAATSYRSTFVPPTREQYNAKLKPVTSSKTLPVELNWAALGKVTPARDQGTCGACWAFAIAGVIESKILIDHNDLQDLSEQWLVSCDVSNDGCEGGTSSGFDFLASRGIVTEAEFDYVGAGVACPSPPPVTSRYLLADYHTSGQSIADIKSALYNMGPLYVWFTTYEDFDDYFFNSGSQAPYSHAWGQATGQHAVTLIGYSDVEQCWILKNSWGEHAGPFNDGTFKIAYTGNCGFEGGYYCEVDRPAEWQWHVQAREDLPLNGTLSLNGHTFTFVSACTSCSPQRVNIRDEAGRQAAIGVGSFEVWSADDVGIYLEGMYQVGATWYAMLHGAVETSSGPSYSGTEIRGAPGESATVTAFAEPGREMDYHDGNYELLSRSDSYDFGDYNISVTTHDGGAWADIRYDIPAAESPRDESVALLVVYGDNDDVFIRNARLVVCTRPSAPSSLAFVPSGPFTDGQSVQLTWNAASGAAYYQVTYNGLMIGAPVNGTSAPVAVHAGAYAVIAVNDCGQTASQSITAAIVANPAPVLAAIDPTSVAAGGGAFTLTVTGSGFTSLSRVHLDGQERATSLLSSTQMTVQVEAADVATTGVVTVTVVTPAPGGGTSNALALTVTAPDRLLTVTAIPSGGGDVTRAPDQATFPPGSMVRLTAVPSEGYAFTAWGGDAAGLTANPLDVVMDADKTITALFGLLSAPSFVDDFDDGNMDGWSTSEFCSTAGSHTFTVGASPLDGTNALIHEGGSAPGGGNGVAYVTTPALVMTDVLVEADVRNVNSYHPTAKGQGLCARLNPATGAQYALWYTTDGHVQLFRASGWFGCTTLASVQRTAWPVGTQHRLGLQVVGNELTVYLDGTPVVQSLVDPDPLPGGTVGVTATSGRTHFDNFSATAVNPMPVLTSLAPTSVQAGSGDFVLAVIGSGFAAPSVVQWNGSARPTTYVNSGQLTAAIGAADIASAGIVNISVHNPGTAGGISNAVPLTIVNPAPVAIDLAPEQVYAGGNAFNLAVDGSGFVAASVVRWNGLDRATSYVNSTRLTAMIPAADIETSGQAQVTVFNPAPAGGASSELTVLVRLCHLSLSAHPTSGGSLETTPDVADVPAGTSIQLTAVPAAGFTFVSWAGDATGQVENPLDLVVDADKTITAVFAAVSPPSFVDDFDDGNMDGWSTSEFCSTAGSHTFTVGASPLDGTNALIHEGGSAPGGGNGVAYVTTPALVMTDVLVEADVRNVNSYHPTAKGQGLCARLNPATGAQYALWYTTDGHVQLFRASGWFGCTTLASVQRTAWPVGTQHRLGLQVVGNELTVYLDGTPVVQSLVDPDPLPGGTVGVTATSGRTHFDNFSATAANPMPVLTSLTPTAVDAGNGSFALTVIGSGFTERSVVQWNGIAKPTTYVDGSQLTATIDAGDVATAQIVNVTVHSPTPGGGITEVAIFSVAGAADAGGENPARRYALTSVTPNPFNPTTTISFSLPQAGQVRIAIYDMSGRLVRTIVDDVRDAGEHRVTWAGMDSNSRPVPSGVYICRMSAANYSATKRMTLAK